MSSCNKKIRYFLLILLLFIIALWCNGKLLDKEAERVVRQLYVRDQAGIIQGLEPIVYTKGHSQALIIFHGFSDSPASYSAVVNDIKNKLKMDIFVPLLPFHGRNLASMTQMTNQEVSNYVKQYTNDLSKKYQSLTVVGHSYSGALLADLALKKELPDNVNLILYAPAVFIQTNTFWERLGIHLFGWWRNYCNYPTIGCNFPTYESGDTAARPLFEKEQSLRYKVIPGIIQVNNLDLQVKDNFSHINRPYSLIIAIDDNRVVFEKQKTACAANQQYCHFYALPPGKHMMHWGANKQAFEDLLVKLATEPPK